MKKNNFRVSAILTTIMLLCAFMFVGCVAETDSELQAGGGEGNLYISIKTETISGNTRAVSITSNPTATYENYLGQTLVFIFDDNGDYVQHKAIDNLSGVAQQMTQFDGQTYGADYTVAVASNLDDDVYDAIITAVGAGNYTLDDLQEVTFTLAQALNDDVLAPTTDADRRIPMYGEGTLVADDAGNYYADVRVKHSLVKVSLKQLVVDFGESSTRNATFKPDQVFMTNVPYKTNMVTDQALALAFSAEGADMMYQGDASATVYTAYELAAKKKANIKTLGGGEDHANIIGTDILTGSDLKTLSTTNSTWLTADDSAPREYYFYTVPSSQTNDDATCLVVSGLFNATGSGDDADATRVYYRVKLNGTGTGSGALTANTNYKVNIIIRGMGGVDAYTDGTDPTLVESFVTIGDFDEDNHDALLGAGAATYTTFTNGHIVKVGDILFSDGTFQSQSSALAHTTAGHTPIGIVFHLFNAAEAAETDAYPNYHGYRGLVMALKDANDPTLASVHDGIKWATATEAATVTAAKFSLTSHTEATAPTGATATTLMRAAARDLKDITRNGNNGLVNWTATSALRTAGENDPATNAFEMVAKFDADGEGTAVTTDVTTLGDLATSGWYLPSIGELYKMCYSLGKLQTSLMNTNAWGAASERESGTNWTPWGMYYTNGQSRVDANSQGVADKVRENINDMIDACGAGTYTPFYGGLNPIGNTSEAADWGAYWSSSEWSGGFAFRLNFSSGGSLFFHRVNAKSDTYRVRPVLAF